MESCALLKEFQYRWDFLALLEREFKRKLHRDLTDREKDRLLELRKSIVFSRVAPP
jgi:hypothetical protein